MTQTYRTNDGARWGAGQGFNLTPAQVDINFWDLIQRVLVLEALPDAAAGIDHFEIVGVNMYVHMTDATVLGPYQLPVATFNDRGVWTPDTVYSQMDTFSINGGLYVVVWDHTSEASFDPGANDGLGHDYYQLMIQTPGSSLPTGGAVGQLLIKTTTSDYAVGWGYTEAGVVDFEPATGSSLTADNVADALEELAAAAISGDAIDVSYDPSTASGLTSTNVQDALDELGASSGGGGGIGKQTIWIPATAMVPRTTNGPAPGTVEMTTNKNMVKTLDFDAATIEYAQFDIAMPKSWDLGDVTYKVFFSHGSGSAFFGVSWKMDAISCSPSNTNLDVPFGTAVEKNVVGGAADRLYATGESDPVTILDNLSAAPADGNLTMFRVYRNASTGFDSLTVDARMHGVLLFYTTNAATDD